MRAMGRKQCQRVSDVATTDREMVVRFVVGRSGTGMELEPVQIKHIVLAEEVDQIAEDVTGESRVPNPERRLCVAGEGEGAGAGRADGPEVERASLDRGASGIGIAGAAQRQSPVPDL